MCWTLPWQAIKVLYNHINAVKRYYYGFERRESVFFANISQIKHRTCIIFQHTTFKITTYLLADIPNCYVCYVRSLLKNIKPNPVIISKVLYRFGRVWGTRQPPLPPPTPRTTHRPLPPSLPQYRFSPSSLTSSLPVTSSLSYLRIFVDF